MLSDASHSPELTGSLDVELRPTRPLGYAAIVTMRGEHDLATSDELASTLAPIAGNLLIDMSGCGFIDSTVIGVVIGKSQELAREGYRLELVVPEQNRIVGRVVDIVGLRTLVTVHREVPRTENALDRAPRDPSSDDTAAGVVADT